MGLIVLEEFHIWDAATGETIVEKLMPKDPPAPLSGGCDCDCVRCDLGYHCLNLTRGCLQ